MIEQSAIGISYQMMLRFKNASSLNIFKNALDNYKNDCLSSGSYRARAGNYWDLSYEVLNCIEDMTIVIWITSNYSMNI